MNPVFRAAPPLLMGVVNVTPDSFFDGGQYARPAAAVARGKRLAAEGADILDVGGESTRPGAAAVPLAEELRRVLPVIAELAAIAPVSVDTQKPAVMRAAAAAGAAMINDVNAFRAAGALKAAAESDCALCVMHRQGGPRTMQKNPRYREVVSEVRDFLEQRAARLIAAGVPRERIFLDPGFGFGKTLPHNLALLRALPRLCESGFPLVVGVSRKSMLGALTGRPAARRLFAGLGAAAFAAANGAAIIRTHDVAATRDALAVARFCGGVK